MSPRSARARALVTCGLAVLLHLAAVSARAEQVRILETDRDAARVRVDLIGAAKAEILAAYFIVEEDATGLAGLHLLREAARRGVDVKLIVDAQWNGVTRPLMSHLAAEGVQVRLYHRFSFFKPLWITRRMHDKLLLVDGTELVAGGRNIENAYFGFGERQYVDRDILVSGDLASEAREYFLALWDSRHVDSPPRGWLSGEWLVEAARQLDEAASIVTTSPLLTDGALDGMAREVAADRLEFACDPVARVRKRPGIRADLLAVLNETRESAVIESPYLVVTPRLVKALAELRSRGVSIRILTNSLKATDNVWPQAGYVGKKKKLVRLGIELWEYTGPRTLHSKTAVFDGKTVVIGSYNLDPRSATRNTEIAVVVRDADVAGEVLGAMDENLKNAWRIGLDGRPVGEKKRHPGVPLWRRIKVRLIRLAVPIIRPQL